MNTADVISLIAKIRGKVNRFIEAEMAQQGLRGIVTSHGDILFALFQQPKLTMAEIAARIGRDKSTVTALVDKLAGLGYVVKERDTEDARVFYLTLTPKGRELQPSFEAISGKVLSVFYQNVSEKEKEELLRILTQIHQNLRD
jgi:DNA-binding MarR family transcriptional regulator